MPIPKFRPSKRTEKDLIDAQFKFDGAWLPSYDPAKIGADNFRTLRNLRYIEGGLEGVLGYTEINTTNISTYTDIRNGFQLRSDRTQKTYVLVHAVDSSGNGRVYENRTAIPDQGDFEGTHQWADASANLSGRFSEAPGNNVAYCNEEESCIWAGLEMRCAGFFTIDDSAGSNPEEYTNQVNNTLQTSAEIVDLGTNQTFCNIFSTRPLKGVKVYIKTANGDAAVLAVKHWTGTSFDAVSNLSDGTDVGGASMAQTGWVTFDSTVSTAVPYHFEGLYLYCYQFELPAGSCEIYHIAVDAPFQEMIDIWDGVYRQMIQCQNYDATNYADYTLHVNESSTLDIPVGCVLDGFLNTDHLILMSEERLSAFKVTMLGGLVNTNASVLTVKYWDGDSWVSVDGLVDGTDNGGVTFGQSGVISWSPPAITAEKKHTLFGTPGYAYRLTVTAALSGTKGGAEEVLADLIYGIPAQQTIRPFKFSGMFKGRLMLGGYTAGKEGNRMDYGLKDGAEVFNGYQSSMDGIQSLYYGGIGEINAAIPLYNRFGSRVFSIYLVFKDNETFLLNGNSPEDYEIFPVSSKIGCPAPLTLDTAEIGFEMSEEIARNVAIWLSYNGPVMFDGAVMRPIKGLEKYFDPNDSDYITVASIENARGWFDPTFREYNLVIPTATVEEPNLWVCYDLEKKKWYEKNPGTSEYPQCGFPVQDLYGVTYTYAGINDGTVLRLENGTQWKAVDMTFELFTGDFFPTDNAWVETRIRWLMVVCKKISEAPDMEVFHYADTDTSAGGAAVFRDQSDGVSWVDQSDGVSFVSAASSTLDLSLGGLTERLTKVVTPMNKLAWAHAFQFKVTTSETEKGFQPILWGIRFEYQRHLKAT